jgi:peptide/nickel transport system permease protein
MIFASSQYAEWVLVVREVLKTKKAKVGLTLVAFVLLAAFLGPFVAPHGDTQFVTLAFSSPSGAAPLGGDALGRDVLSRVLDGGWELILIAIASTALGVGFGATLGISAAYLGGRRDNLIMRCVDVVLAFPQLVFALLVVSVIGPKVWLLIVAIGISHAPQVARVSRGATLDIAQRDYVHAAELRGVPARVIMRREILPGLTGPLMVETGLRFTLSIVLIAGLSFIGFGLQPPAQNRIGLTSNPWAVAVPAGLIAILAIGANTLTDAVALVALGADRRERLTLIELEDPDVAVALAAGG